jgi:hypothetical protein
MERRPPEATLEELMIRVDPPGVTIRYRRGAVEIG